MSTRPRDVAISDQFEKVAKLSASTIVALGATETAILKTTGHREIEVFKNLPEDFFLTLNAGTVTLTR